MSDNLTGGDWAGKQALDIEQLHFISSPLSGALNHDTAVIGIVGVWHCFANDGAVNWAAKDFAWTRLYIEPVVRPMAA